MKTQDKFLVVVGTTVVLTVASLMGYTLFVTKDSDIAKASTTSTTSSSISSGSPTTTQQTSSSASATTTYKDGMYTTTASYDVPGGDTNKVTVNVMLKNGVVMMVSTTHDYASGQSGRYIDWFDQEIKSAVVGKALSDLSVSRVGGASLTSIGFDDALDTIRNDAKI